MEKQLNNFFLVNSKSSLKAEQPDISTIDDLARFRDHDKKFQFSSRNTEKVESDVLEELKG